MIALPRLLPTLIALFLISVSIPSQAQTATKVKTDEELIRENMVVISRQLGVTCTVCHNTDNFKSDKLTTFKVAKEHMKLTQLLIDSGMNGKTSQKADCYLCHRGKLQPDSVEKIPPVLKK